MSDPELTPTQRRRVQRYTRSLPTSITALTALLDADPRPWQADAIRVRIESRRRHNAVRRDSLALKNADQRLRYATDPAYAEHHRAQSRAGMRRHRARKKEATA